MRAFLPKALGMVTLAGVVLLLVWDFFPELFPAKAHEVLAAFPLAMIAFAYLVYQVLHRRSIAESAKAALLAGAFFFWAANQLWPALHWAMLFNDIAIALFVLDIFLVMIGWPASSNESS